MKSFTKIQLSKIVRKDTLKVEIYKFRKEGTKREFFSAEVNGTRLTNTMFARLYDATRYVNNVLGSNELVSKLEKL